MDEEIIEDEINIEDEDVDEVSKAKSDGAKKRWDLSRSLTNPLDKDRSVEKFNYKCFENMRLSDKQKEFVVTFMNPPYLGKKEFRNQVYAMVYNPSNENSCKANCSILLNKPKVQDAMRKYQIFALKNHRQEVTSEAIEIYRKRATYTLDKFYTKEGLPLPLDQIDVDWLVCIDNLERKVSTKTEKDIVNYKLCDRDRAMKTLQDMLNIANEGDKVELSVSSGGNSVIDDAEGKNNNAGGPRIVLNMSVGNQNKG